MMAKKAKNQSKIHLDKKVVEAALEDQKKHLTGLIEDPQFREFWKLFGGDTEFLDEKKKKIKDWKVK
jgi:hypothetical protein